MKNIIIKMLPLILAIILSAYNGFSQDYKCGTVITEDFVQKIVESRNKNTDNFNKSPNTTLQVAVRAHVIRDDNGSGGLTTAQLSTAMIQLNAIFSDANIVFTTREINNIHCSEYFEGINNDFELSELGKNAVDNNLLNIYFVPNLHNGDGVMLGTPADPEEDFIAIENASSTYGTTLAHEVGHFFGLCHTHDFWYIDSSTGQKSLFEDRELGRENVTRDENHPCYNCDRTGDLLCSTPADPYDFLASWGYYPQNIEAVHPESCTSLIGSKTTECTSDENYELPTNNIMSYYFYCRNKFTSEQIEVMRGVRESIRDYIYGNCGGSPNSTCFDETISECDGICPSCPTPSSTLYFDCELGCDNNLVLNCGALSAATALPTITISNLQILNEGNSTASNVEIEYTLVDTGSHVIGTQTVAGPIAPGAYITAEAPYLWLTDVPTGSYYLQAKLKDGSGSDHVCESDSPINVGILSGEGVDLEFISCGSISANSSGYTIPYSLQNKGWGTASSTRLGVYLSNDAILDASDTFIKDAHIPDLGGYESINFSTQFLLDDFALPDGDVYIILKADNNNQESETNEDNNECAYQLNACDSYSRSVNGNLTNDVEATSDITAPAFTPSLNNTTTISPSVNVNFKAGKYIDLIPGFTAEYSSIFTAYIESCSIPSFDGTKETTEQDPVTLRNYPNPFTGQTTIEFVLPEDSSVTLFVSDMNGRKIAALLDNEAQIKGTRQVIFDGSDFPAGMYYYTIQAGEYIGTQKMILVK